MLQLYHGKYLGQGVLMSNLTNPRVIPTPRDERDNDLMQDDRLSGVVAFEGADSVYIREIAATKKMSVTAYLRWCVIEQTKLERKNRGR